MLKPKLGILKHPETHKYDEDEVLQLYRQLELRY
jgi:hypothetical protein